MAQIDVARIVAWRAAVSGSMPASHSRRCTSIVAFEISALPPTWSKWKCELMTRSIRAGSRRRRIFPFSGFHCYSIVIRLIGGPKFVDQLLQNSIDPKSSEFTTVTY